MNEKAKKAVELHNNGYNCAQAVTCTFAEELGRDEKTVYEMMEGFGFGMGSSKVCGTVSAMAAISGMVNSEGTPGPDSTKRNSYRGSKSMVKKFEEKNGTIICRELKGVDTGKLIRDCDGCVEDAATIVDEYLERFVRNKE